MLTEYQPDIEPKRLLTSEAGDNPWKLINRRSKEGRRIRAIVLRLLADVPTRDDPLVIEHAISIAQLMIRAGEMRADPLRNAAEAATLIRIEHLVDQRVRRLAFARSRGGSAPAQSTIPTIGNLLAARQS